MGGETEIPREAETSRAVKWSILPSIGRRLGRKDNHGVICTLYFLGLAGNWNFEDLQNFSIDLSLNAHFDSNV